MLAQLSKAVSIKTLHQQREITLNNEYYKACSLSHHLQAQTRQNQNH
jgi:hypothetical protein